MEFAEAIVYLGALVTVGGFFFAAGSVVFIFVLLRAMRAMRFKEIFK